MDGRRARGREKDKERRRVAKIRSCYFCCCRRFGGWAAYLAPRVLELEHRAADAVEERVRPSGALGALRQVMLFRALRLERLVDAGEAGKLITNPLGGAIELEGVVREEIELREHRDLPQL